MPENSYITVDTLKSKLDSLSADDKMKALEALSAVGIDFSQNKKELTNTKVVAFVLGIEAFKVVSHKEIFLKIAEIVLRKFPDKEHLIFEIKGTKKIYFSRDQSDFKNDYEPILGTKIYADTNENASQLNRRCQRILQKYGIDPASLLVIHS